MLFFWRVKADHITVPLKAVWFTRRKHLRATAARPTPRTDTVKRRMKTWRLRGERIYCTANEPPASPHLANNTLDCQITVPASTPIRRPVKQTVTLDFQVRWNFPFKSRSTCVNSSLPLWPRVSSGSCTLSSFMCLCLNPLKSDGDSSGCHEVEVYKNPLIVCLVHYNTTNNIKKERKTTTKMCFLSFKKYQQQFQQYNKCLFN